MKRGAASHEGALVFGVKPVLELLRAGRSLRRVLIERGNNEATHRLTDVVERAGICVEHAAKSELDRLTGHAKHQGVLAFVADASQRGRAMTLDDVLAAARRAEEDPLVVIADGVQDPRNLGAIIRCAWALGAHGIIVPDRRAAPVTAAVMKTSAGAAAHLPVLEVTNVKHAIAHLKDANVWCVAAALNATPLDECRLDGPLAIVLGSEDRGVRPTVAKCCDAVVTIPLRRGFDSLNVAVSAGILLHEVARRRRRGGDA